MHTDGSGAKAEHAIVPLAYGPNLPGKGRSTHRFLGLERTQNDLRCGLKLFDHLLGRV
jgi:hypothetical protein